MVNSVTGNATLAPDLTAGDGYDSVIGGTGTAFVDTGTLNVGSILAGIGQPGYLASVDGRITVTGDGVQVIATDRITMAIADEYSGAYGLLNIYDGAYVLLDDGIGGTSNLIAGVGSNFHAPVGRINVSGTGAGGAGSSLILNGPDSGFVFGAFGATGELNVTNGGYFRTLTGIIGAGDNDPGEGYSGIGRVTVDGAGSEFKASTLSGNFVGQPDQAPIIYVARDDATGSLYAENGGLITIQNEIGDGKSSPTLIFGVDSESDGLGAVLSGSTLNIIQNGPATGGNRLNGNSGLIIGDAGEGNVFVDGNSYINVLGDRANLVISRGSYDGQGAPVSPGSLSLLRISGASDVLIDSQTYGEQGGATVTLGAGRLTDGRIQLYEGSLTVRSDTDIVGDQTTGKIVVGDLGQGDIVLENNTRIDARELVIGARGYTTNPINNSTDQIYEGQSLAVGGGTGQVSIINSDASIVITGTDNSPDRGITLGQASETFGTLNIYGANSYVKSTGGAGQIVIGRYGEASVGVTGGGALYGNTIIVSEQSSGDDTDSLVITGVGSKVVADGYYGRTLDGGGLDTGASASIQVGLGYYSMGSISVLNGGELRVENDTGIDQNPRLVIGVDYGATGSVSVLGSGSPTPATSTINIIQQGARFMAPSGDVFGGAELTVGLGGVGTLTAGYYSTVNIQGDSAALQVGVGGYDGMGAPILSDSPSVLTIQNGADVLVDSETYGFDQTAGDYSSGSSVIVGGFAGGYGQIFVDGSGSTLTVDSQSNFAGDYQTGRLVIGELGDGYLNVANGGTVDARMLQVAARSFYDDGSGPVSGGYLPNVTYAANGFVYINSGSQITVTAESNTPSTGIRIAEGSGTTGSILVRGSGSTLTSQGGEGRVLVGRYGTGDLFVDTGGQVRGFSFDIGRSQGSDGTVSVDGYGSSVLVSNAYGDFSAEPEFAGEAGFLRLGREAGSSGSLQITNAGRVDVINDPATNYDNPFVQIGRNNGSYGNLLVDGYYAGSGSYYSQLNIIQTGPVGDFVATGGIGPYGPGLAVGQGGQGIAAVSDLGQILIQGAAAKLSVASGRRDGSGNPDTTTDLSTLTISGGSSVLVDSQFYGGSQDFTDPMGGTITANLGAQVTVGSDIGANGQITVDGYGSTLTVTSSNFSAYDYSTGSIRVGLNGGTGALNLTNGGGVYGRGLNLGFDAGSVGDALLTGGSTIGITGIEESAYQGITIGRGGGTGTLTLQGSSSVTSAGGTGRLQVGRDGGAGTLEIQSGSTVEAFFTEIGRGSGSVGVLNIDGYQSRFTSSDAFGAFDPASYGPRGGFVRVGRGDGGDGTVTITGGGSLNVINDDMVAPPAQADGATLEIGRDTGATGYVRVSGDDGMGNASYIRVQNYGRSNDGYVPGEYYGPELRLGRDGATGELVVEQGAFAGAIGERAQIVIGQGTENGDFAAEPTSLISVTSGGTLTADSRPNLDYSRPYIASADIVLGRETGGNGRLLVTGAGSTVNVLSDNAGDYYLNGDLSLGAGLEVGKFGRGVLDVENGGQVIIDGADDAFPHLTIGVGLLGSTISAYGYATVSGAGSQIQIIGTSAGAGAYYQYGAGGSIDVGTRDGTFGQLVISDGGVVSNSAINSKTQIAQNTGATGEITVTGAGSTLNAGTLLTVGADIDLATGDFYDLQSGDATLTIYDQGVVSAGSTFVGSTGLLNIDNATLTSDVEIAGDFQIADNNIGSATIAGALTVTSGTLEFDLFANGAGITADALTAGSATFSGSSITVEVGAAFLLNVGDSATLFSTQGGLTIDSLETINFIGGTANAGQEFSVDLLTLPFGQNVTTQLVFNVQQATLASVDGDFEIVAAQGGQVAFTKADVLISENGIDPSVQILTVSGVFGGQIESALDPGVAITVFTQQDIDDRLIRFVSDGSSGGSVDLSFTDSAGFTDFVTISVIEGALNPLAEINVGDLDGTNGVTFNGIVAGDQTGLGVSDVGDINGDGISDISIGASFADTPAGNDSGEAYVIFGVDGGPASPIELLSLDGTNGFTFTGLGPSQLTGVNGSIEGVGDVNNDGIDDFLVGIGGVDSGGVFNVGEAFLIYGNVNGFGASFDLGNLNGTNGTRLVGIDVNSLTGQTVPGLGDVNGDGINDFGISASFGDGAAGVDSGESFVVFGADGGLGATVQLSSLDGTNGFRLEGETAGDNGGVIGRVGDFNNDGINDFLVGTPNDDNANGANAGNVQIIFGTTATQSAVRQIGAITPAEGFRIIGLAPNDGLGGSVSDGGDINGDGIDDLIITAKTADVGGVVDAGTTYVIFGTSDDLGGTFDLSTLDGSNGFSVSGSVAIQRAGYTSASAGDVNGDGIEDLIIGSVRGAPGEAFVIFGSTAPFAATFDLASLNGVNGFQITGSSVDGVLGRDVSTAGDFNNDGIDDILVGSNTADPGGRINAGEAYVIYGVAGAGILPAAIDGDFLVEVLQGQSVVLTTADLTASEPNALPADLLYHVTNVVGGIVSTIGAPGVPVSTFTQADLEAGQISFEHDGATPSGVSFDVTVTDNEGDVSGPATVAADVLIPNEAPEIEVAIPNMAVFTDDVNNFFFSPSLGQGSLLFTDFSISFFAEIDQVNVGADYFISYTSPDFTQALGVFASGDNINLTYNDQFLGTLSATGLSDGEVHHVALTYDQGAESFRIFLDGADLGTLDAMGAGRLRAGGQFVLGEGFDPGNGRVPDEGLIGALGSVRVRSIELDPLDVLQESLGILGGATPGLLRDFQVQFGAASSTVIVKDVSGNSGTPGNLQSSGTNDLREPIRATEDIAIITPEIIITDVDNSDGNQEVTLSVTNGVITLQDLTGLTITAGANGSNTVTFQGATGDIRVALQQVEYLADPDFDGSDILTVDTDDLGNTGIGGPLTDSRDILIGIAAVNDDPVAFDDFVFVTEDDAVSGNVFSDNGNGIDFDVDSPLFTVVAVDGSPTNVNAPFITSGGGQITFTSDGDFSFLTNGAYDTLSAIDSFDEVFTYTIEDDLGGQATANFTLTVTGVNDAPVAQDDAFLTDEDTLLVGDLFADNGAGVDQDVDLDSFLVSAINGDDANVGVPIQLGGLGGTLLVQNDGTFEFTPGAGADALTDGEFGAASFTYEIADSAGEFSVADVLITINGVNDAPVAFDDQIFVVADQTVIVDPILGDGVSGADFDAEGGVLTIVTIDGNEFSAGDVITLPSGANVAANLDGTLEYLPSGAFDNLGPNQSAQDSFAYEIEDDGGLRSSAQVFVEVQAPPFPPIAVDDAVTTSEDDSIAFDLFADNGNGLDQDFSNGGLFLTQIEGAPILDGQTILLGSGATLTVQSDGNVIYDPLFAFDDLPDGGIATETFIYTITDAAGLSASAEAVVTITGVNDAPVAINDEITFGEEDTAIFNVLDDNGGGPDFDVDLVNLSVQLANGQPVARNAALTFSTTLGLQATINADGDVIIEDPGSVLDTLAAGATAQDFFVYQITDEGGLTASAQVNLTITGENDAPVASDDDISLFANATLEFDPINGSTGPDLDIDGDVLFVAEINGVDVSAGDIVTLASGARVGLNANGRLVYLPSGAFDGLPALGSAADSFTYTVSDPGGLRDQATVNVEIQAPVDPVAGDDAVTASENGLTTFDLFADNGAGPDQNFSGGDLLLTEINGGVVADGASVTLASGAVLTIDETGTVSYDPGQAFDALSEGQTGTDSFFYTVTDASGLQDVGEVTVSVVGANDAPVAANDLFRTDERTALSANLFIGNGAGPDRDVDGGDFAITAINGDAALVGTEITLPSGALLTVNPDGAVTFDPNGGFFALNDGDRVTETLTYTITDDQGATSDATVAIRIDGVTDTIFGTNGDDFIRGTESADNIEGLDGADLITGLAGDDTINGGAGSDIIRGGADNDHLIGGASKDRMFGESGDDLIEGGGGNDRLLGLAGDDTISGDAGNDLVGGGSGRDRVDGGDGDDRVRGGRDSDTLLGGAGIDRLQGGNGADLMFGQTGNDNLTGGGGSDTMLGGSGIDRFFGRRGDDRMTGGEGGDRFIFNLGDGNDTITDFDHGADRIRIGTGAEVFGDLTITQVGDDVRIAFGNVTILSLDDDANNFGVSDFIL